MSSGEEESFSPTKRKVRCTRLQIEEDDDSGSSTGDSVVGGDRRRRCRQIESEEEDSSDPELEDSGVNVQSENEDHSSDDDDESDNWEDIEEEALQDAVDSDASNSQSERCAICLNRFLGQEIGIPESCDHPFCLECLLEWAKKINTCPVDRKVFHLVLVKLELDEKVVRKVPVKSPESEEPEEDEELTYCEVCARSDREDRLLLCDACDLAYHCECLEPPLDTIPVEEWYCPNCTPPPSDNDDVMPEDLVDEFTELLATRFRPQTARRAIARTRASETVRSRIQRRRTAAGTVNSSLSSRPRTKRKVTHRKRRTKRRAKKGKKIASAKGSTKRGKKTTRRKRSSKKRKRRSTGRTRRAIQAARPLVCPTVKKRIAERLGLEKPPPGHMLPLVRQPAPARNFFSDTGLLLFGDRDELHSFEGVYEDDSGGDISVVRANAACRRAPLKSKDILSRTSVPYPPSFDLLGSILQTQSVLHSDSRNVKIGWDGSLVPSSSVMMHCPLGSGSESSDPLPDGTHTKSCTQSPSDVRYSPTEPTACSSGGENSEDCADATNTTSFNDSSSNYHKCPSEPPRSPKVQPNKENNKLSASDDDIDIYSDIESISNDTTDDLYCADTVVAERCDPTSPMDHQPVLDSSEDELIIDEEAEHPESEQEELDTPNKNGLPSPEEDYDDAPSEAESVADRAVEEIDVCGFESGDATKSDIRYDDSEEVKEEEEVEPASPDLDDSMSTTPHYLEKDSEQPDDEDESDNSYSNAAQEENHLDVPTFNCEPSVQTEEQTWSDDEEKKVRDHQIEPVTKRKEGGHVDEDDVISAKVGSPISENEDHAAAKSHLVESTVARHSACGELLEEGEIVNVEEAADDAEEQRLCFSTKLEGVEDVSEVGSDDNQLEDDEKEEEEVKEDADVDDVEAKVAELFREDSKQQQSEEEEGLCESEPENVLEAAETPTLQKMPSTRHSSTTHVKTAGSSAHRHREHSTTADTGGTIGNKRPEQEISWKKLSKSTKERSYRDGKLRDERILFRERELKDKDLGDLGGRSSRKRGNGCRHTRKTEEDRGSNRHDTGKRTSGGKSSKYKESSVTGNRHESKTGSSSKQRHLGEFYDRHEKKWNYESKHSAGGGEKRPSEKSERHRTDKASSSSYKHKEYKYDQYSSKYEDCDKHYKYEQQLPQMCEEVASDKRRRDKRKEREVRKVEDKIIVEKKSSKEKKKSAGGSGSQKKKKKRTPSPVISEVSDVESKEVYSKGGSIIINVNYNRSTGKETTSKHLTSKKANAEVRQPVVIEDDSDSWAASDAKKKSGWDDEDDDEIQIVCEKKGGTQEKRPTTPPVVSKRKKEEAPPPKQAPPKPTAFDMFWRDVEDISQDAKEEEEEEAKVEEDVPETVENNDQEVGIHVSEKEPSPIRPDSSNSLNFSGMFKKQPRSPSPPSPSDDESYDPCRPTRSPSPKPQSEVEPKPPPEPILPPLPSEPEPKQPSPPPPLKSTAFESLPVQQPFITSVPTPTQFPSSPTVMQSGGPMPMPNIRVPPPNFMSPGMGRSPAGIVQTLRPWPMANGPPPMIFQPTQMQHVIRGSFIGHSGLQPGMLPHPAMMRPPIGGPGMMAAPTAGGATGAPMQTMLMPDLSHPPPPLVMQGQPAFSVPSSTATVVTSVPVLVPLVTVAQPSGARQDVAAKEGSDSVVDMDVESPYSPVDSPGADFADEPSPEPDKRPSTPPKEKDRFDALLEAVPRLLADKRTRELLAVLRPKVSAAGSGKAEKKGSVAAAATSTTVAKADSRTKHRHKTSKRKGIAVKMKESQLKILDELPSSAVEMQVKEKFLKKLNRQERVVEEVKHALKPFYNKRDIDKLEYKSILRKCVPKICHNKTGEINPVKIKSMVEGYVHKYRHGRKRNLKGGDS